MSFIGPVLKYKKIYKLKFKNLEINSCSTKLQYGDFGLKSLCKTNVQYQQVWAARHYLLKKIKGFGYLSVRCMPRIPHTLKKKGLRMGKGKGGVEYWTCPLKSGTVIFEIAGPTISFLKVRNILSQVQKKLSFKTKIVFF